MSEDNKEKSAIDAIYEILARLTSLEYEIKNIDSNIKLLNNKITKLNVVNKKKVINSTPRAVAPAAVVQPKTPESLTESVKVFGRIKNKSKKPVKGISVKIHTRQGEIIKTRITDDKGYWEARIQPGEYGIEYDPSEINKRLRPVNFKVVVEEGLKELDISEINKL
jgi:hypothetical protein